MSERYDAIIIGAGVIGACTAFELAKRYRDNPKLTAVRSEGMSEAKC
jgi:glycine/D-amino acid oxidase-like deaminating enzyme